MRSDVVAQTLRLSYLLESDNSRTLALQRLLEEFIDPAGSVSFRALAYRPLHWSAWSAMFTYDSLMADGSKRPTDRLDRNSRVQRSGTDRTLLRRIDEFIRPHPHFIEVIVVADGCTDGTVEIVRQVGAARLRVIDNNQNRGKGYCVGKGVQAATGDYVLFVDTDLSAPIEEVDKLLDVAVNEHAEVVIGSRNVDRTAIETHHALVSRSRRLRIQLRSSSPAGTRFPRHAMRLQTVSPAENTTRLSTPHHVGMGFRPRVAFPRKTSRPSNSRGFCTLESSCEGKPVQATPPWIPHVCRPVSRPLALHYRKILVRRLVGHS
jgi:hypothetical protein